MSDEPSEDSGGTDDGPKRPSRRRAYASAGQSAVSSGRDTLHSYTTGGEARAVVLGSLLVTGVMVTIRDVSAGKRPDTRFILGLVAAGFVLSLLADIAPALAASLAAMLALGTVLEVGAGAFATIGKAVAP